MKLDFVTFYEMTLDFVSFSEMILNFMAFCETYIYFYILPIYYANKGNIGRVSSQLSLSICASQRPGMEKEAFVTKAEVKANS